MKLKYGYTFIEMLVSLFLSMLLLTGLITVYLTVKSQYFAISSLGDLQDRVRFVSELLWKNIREAGDANCENNREFVDHAHAIYGYKNTIIIGQCVYYKKKNQFIQMHYFVSDTHRKNSKGRPIYALYRKPLGGEREELIAGVSSMTVQYGVATKNYRNVSHYVSANTVHDWKQIKSVSINLLLNYINTIKVVHLYVDLREQNLG